MIGISIKPKGDFRRAMTAVDPVHARQAIERALDAELEYLRAKVVEAYETAGASNGRPWPPNKDGRKPFDGSTVVKYVKAKRRGLKGEVFVPHGARFRNGAQMTRVLAAHESGMVIAIPVTERMLRGLHAKLRAQPGGGTRSGNRLRVGDTMLIRLPRRSAFADTLDVQTERTPERFRRKMLVRLAPLGWRPG